MATRSPAILPTACRSQAPATGDAKTFGALLKSNASKRMSASASAGKASVAASKGAVSSHREMNSQSARRVGTESPTAPPTPKGFAPAAR